MSNPSHIKHTVLIVDDDEEWLNTATAYLETDYTIIQATTAETAHKFLLEKKCDLAIIDKRLDPSSESDVSGFLLSATVEDIPKILVSAWNAPENLALKNELLKKKNYPPIRFVSKSVSHSELREIVRETLDTYDKKRGQSVFVVHGRNEKIRIALFEFLRSIGLHPIPWTDATVAAGASPFISEILDKAFEEAKAIIVLLTPDDEAKLKKSFVQPNDPAYEKKLCGQVRPNVLFEAGLAFGRKPTNTVLVQVGEVRPFSDIAGKYIIHLTNSIPKRRQLANHLEKAGCVVNLDDEDYWQIAGDFSV